MLTPFSAESSIRPNTLLTKGFISMNALKKAAPERIKETLRVVNYLARSAFVGSTLRADRSQLSSRLAGIREGEL